MCGINTFLVSHLSPTEFHVYDTIDILARLDLIGLKVRVLY